MTRTSYTTIVPFLISTLALAGCAASPSVDDPAAAGPTAAIASPARGEHHSGGQCTPATQESRWAEMVQAPIELPNRAALLDLGGHHGAGITLADVQDILCQGSDQGDQFGDGSDVYAFGNNQEVWFDFTPPDGTGVFITLWPGYEGQLSFQNHHAHYTIAVNSQILKDGQPFQLDWADSALISQETNELWRALSATFSHGPPPGPGVDCGTTVPAACVRGTFGTVGFIYFPTFGFALWVDDFTAPQPAPSTPTRLDLYKQ
jgi:hypothetical protein